MTRVTVAVYKAIKKCLEIFSVAHRFFRVLYRYLLTSCSVQLKRTLNPSRLVAKKLNEVVTLAEARLKNSKHVDSKSRSSNALKNVSKHFRFFASTRCRQNFRATQTKASAAKLLEKFAKRGCISTEALLN